MAAKTKKPAGSAGRSGRTGGVTPIKRLLGIIARLRGEGGCPWDREQTLETLKQYLIEETYEVIDAIDSGDPAKHREELGDVLLQVVLHAQIRNERAEFDFDDIVNTLSDKIIRRHPHVFGDVKVKNSGQVLKNWEVIKAEERRGEKKSLFDGVPRHLPALQKAQRIQSRASRVGFDWVKINDVMAKIDEELRETRQAIRTGDQARIKDEIGDLLFAVVNLSRFRKIGAEEALEGTIKKFTGRFHEVEKLVHASGRTMSGCTLAELDAYWNSVKKLERKRVKRS